MNFFAWCPDHGDKPEVPNKRGHSNAEEAAVAYVRWREGKWGEYHDVVHVLLESEGGVRYEFDVIREVAITHRAVLKIAGSTGSVP